jgi:hypothetical protein
MYDAMMMHKIKITNKSNIGIFLGRYSGVHGGLHLLGRTTRREREESLSP